MQIITSRASRCGASRAGIAAALAGSALFGPAQAQTMQMPSSMDQLEKLLREQHTAQARQTYQLQAIRQQLDEQSRLNEQQDWQWMGGLTVLLTAALALAWLYSRWPAWRMALAASKERKTQQLKSALAKKQLMAQRMREENEQISGGDEIDHTGSGMLAHLLRRRKFKHAVRDDGVKSGWKVFLDDSDSQLLADEAVREYELRKTVGLDKQGFGSVSAADTEKTDLQAQQTESAWAAMQDVPLNVAATEVGAEVQRIRSNLRQRREERNLTTMTATASADLAAGGFDSPALYAEEAPCSTPAALIPLASPLPAPTVTAPVASNSQILASEKITNTEIRREPALSTSFSVSSLPSSTETETRLALGYEFQKLGQLDEAAMLYEEVLAIGNAVDQFHARKLLSALPGR